MQINHCTLKQANIKKNAAKLKLNKICARKLEKKKKKAYEHKKYLKLKICLTRYCSV